MNDFISVTGLGVDFNLPVPLFAKRQILHAVRDVSFTVKQGETLAIVGESGSGKSTIARSILHLHMPSRGEVQIAGQSLATMTPDELRRSRSRMQMIFQDPVASLSPRRTVRQIIEEPLQVHRPHMTRREREEEVVRYMTLMGLTPAMANRYPHEFSGGQAQRIGIARALILEPELIVADEPVSALDVSIQAQVLDLLAEIKSDRELTMVFISHDLGVVQQVADTLLVLFHGCIMEMGDAKVIYDNPVHPYTRRLLAAVPTMNVLESRRRRQRSQKPPALLPNGETGTTLEFTDGRWVAPFGLD